MFINPEDCNLNNHHCKILKINVKILKIWPGKAVAGLICTIRVSGETRWNLEER
jgi:hypothetical protein